MRWVFFRRFAQDDNESYKFGLNESSSMYPHENKANLTLVVVTTSQLWSEGILPIHGFSFSVSRDCQRFVTLCQSRNDTAKFTAIVSVDQLKKKQIDQSWDCLTTPERNEKTRRQLLRQIACTCAEAREIDRYYKSFNRTAGALTKSVSAVFSLK